MSTPGRRAAGATGPSVTGTPIDFRNDEIRSRFDDHSGLGEGIEEGA
jgi:hypothetical protein